MPIFHYFRTAITNSSITSNDNEPIKPRSLRFTWSMKTTSSLDPNDIMQEIRKVTNTYTYLLILEILNGKKSFRKIKAT